MNAAQNKSFWESVTPEPFFQKGFWPRCFGGKKITAASKGFKLLLSRL